jgi:hypothetical protein
MSAELPGAFGQFVVIEFDAKTRPLGQGDAAVLLLHWPALDDVIGQMMIVRVGGETDVWQSGTETVVAPRTAIFTGLHRTDTGRGP